MKVLEASGWNKVFDRAQPDPRINSAVITRVCHLSDKGDSILEIGPGQGACAIELAKRGRNVFVADSSERALQQVEHLALNHGAKVQSIFADGEGLPIADSSFHVVYSQGLVEHFSDPHKLISEMARVTQPGGFVLVDVPQLYSIQHIYKTVLMAMGKWQFGWERSYSAGQLTDLLTCHNLTKHEDPYAWGIVPPIPQSISPALAEISHAHGFKSRLLQSVRIFNTHPVENNLGTHILNNIGIVGKKI